MKVKILLILVLSVTTLTAFAQDGGSVADVGSRELHVSDNANIAYQSHYPPQNRDSLQTVFARCAKGAFAVPYFLIPHTNI